MTIPLLLVCDGDEPKQATLEGLVKNEPGLKYIATVPMQEGTTAVERAVKVGAKLIWIDLDEEPVEGLNLLAETRKLHPTLNVIVSRTQLDPDMVRAALQLGALDFLDSARAAQQLNVVVENLKYAGADASGSTHSTVSQTTVPQVATHAAPAATMSPPASGGNKWGDLDSIPTPGAKSAQDVTGEINVANSGIQNLVAPPNISTSQAPAVAPLPMPTPTVAPSPVATPAPAPAAAAGGSKWGDLDAIGAPGAAPASAAPAAPMAAPQAVPAPVAPAAVPVQASALPATAAAEPAPTSAGNPGATGGAKWGDLDAIPTPKATAEIAIPVQARPEAPLIPGVGASAGLDAIRTPSDAGASLPKPLPHSNTNKALRPSPEKAELYGVQSPVMMALVILIIIMAGIAFMMFKQHH